MPKSPKAPKVKKHAEDGRNVRVYVALLKKTDPYGGSKAQREHRKAGKA